MAKLNIKETTLPGVKRVNYPVFPDDRGSVMEFYRHSDYVDSGLPSLGDRPQVNAPLTEPGAIRGIHAERAHKLVAVGFGKIFAAIVDLDIKSAGFGNWEGFELERGEGLFVPSGYGNSFQSLETSLYLYYFEQEWFAGMPGVACNPLDSELAIPWPIDASSAIISEKDLGNPTLEDLRNRETTAS
jgi:dTDP-4-dehydrorhamnose 3,5-epimerase